MVHIDSYQRNIGPLLLRLLSFQQIRMVEAEMLVPVGIAGLTRIAGFILRVALVVSLVILVEHLPAGADV